MPRLKVSQPDQERTEYEFGEQEVTIGRGEQNLIVINDGTASRRHAVVEFLDGSWRLRDLGSANGTFYRGARIESLMLSDRDRFEIAGHGFDFSLGVESKTASVGAAAQPVTAKAVPGSSPAIETRKNSSLERCSPPLVTIPAPVPGAPASKGMGWQAAMLVVATLGMTAWWGLSREAATVPAPPVGMPSGVGEATMPATVPEAEKASVLSQGSPPGAVETGVHVGTEPMKAPQPEVPAQAEQPPPMARNRELLFQASEDDLGFQPVFNLRFDQVLHMKKSTLQAAGGPWLDVFLNGRPVVEQVKISSESQLRFPSEGVGWAVQGMDVEGRQFIALEDRRLEVQDKLQHWMGNQDFTVISSVVRKNEEDHLYINGQWKSSYHHIRGPQVSQDGVRWAYKAVRSPGSELSNAPAGERVVTQAGAFEACEQVLHLQMAPDGSRVVWWGRLKGGRQVLMADDRLLHELSAGAQEEFQSITFAEHGRRLVWAVVPESGDPVFHSENRGRFPVAVLDGGEQAGAGASLLEGGKPYTRVVPSGQGGRVVLAAVGSASVLMHENGQEFHPPPLLLLDSITLAPDGRRLAYVTLQPLAPVTAGGMQPHRAVLWADGEKVMEEPGVLVRRTGQASTLMVGGISGLRFSPDSRRLACLVSAPRPSLPGMPKQVFVDGQPITSSHEDALGTYWLDGETLIIAVTASDGGPVERILHRLDQTVNR